VDWRNKTSWGCNQRMNPTGEKWMDGTTLSPHELMFIKVKDHLLLSTNSLSKAAARTSDWLDGLVCPPPPPSPSPSPPPPPSTPQPPTYVTPQESEADYTVSGNSVVPSFE